MRYLLILSFLFLSLAVEGSALNSPKKRFEAQEKAKHSIIPKQKTTKAKFKKAKSIKLIHFLKKIQKQKSRKSEIWFRLISIILLIGLGIYIMVAINILLYLGLLLVAIGVFMFFALVIGLTMEK